MGEIKFSEAEEILYNDFKDGNSVQVRVSVSPSQEIQYQKGSIVKVSYKGIEAKGKIVSDPLKVRPNAENGEEIISLIIEQTNPR